MQVKAEKCANVPYASNTWRRVWYKVFGSATTKGIVPGLY
jgi:hypothetical protein